MSFDLTVVSALLLGFLGSTHCLGMCGGIAASMALSGNHFRFLLGYNAGRIFSYTLAGLLVGSLGLFSQSMTSALVLRTPAALMLVLMGLYIGQWWRALTYLEKAGQGLWSLIRPAASRLLPVKNLPQAMLLGFFWGWLPCGLIYSTLVWSAGAGDPISSATLMLCFGLGTLPAMLTTGLIAHNIKQLMQTSWMPRVSGLLVILMGLASFPWQGWLSLIEN
jgi:sulfite exporter TauE/SafE